MKNTKTANSSFAAATEVLAGATVPAYTTPGDRVRTAATQRFGQGTGLSPAPRLRLAQGTVLSAAGWVGVDDRAHTPSIDRTENVPAAMFVGANGKHPPREVPQ